MARPLQLPPQPLWLRLHCDVSAQRNRTPVPFCQSFASLTTAGLSAFTPSLFQGAGKKKWGEKKTRKYAASTLATMRKGIKAMQ